MSALPKRLVADLEFIQCEESSVWIARIDASLGTNYDDALAAEIARRWNTHEALVEALRALVGDGPNKGEVRALEAEGLIDAADMHGYEVARCIEAARAALRDAEVKP